MSIASDRRTWVPAVLTPVGTMRVLLANEPRSYRETLAAAIPALRPGVEVVAVAPGDLDGAIAHHRPHLVVCSALTPLVQQGALAWLLLYPDGASGSVRCLAEERADIPRMDLSGLLGLLDATGRLIAGDPDRLNA